MHIAFPWQHGYTNTLQNYVIHMLPILLYHDFIIVLGMAMKYFDNYVKLTKNLLTPISSTSFQYACQSNLPSTVRVLVQIGFANIQARNSDTGNCYELTYLLTAWCRVLLDKLIGLQLVKKFPAFHGTPRFITTLTSVRQLYLSWASPIQSIYPHPTSWRSILI